MADTPSDSDRKTLLVIPTDLCADVMILHECNRGFPTTQAVDKIISAVIHALLETADIVPLQGWLLKESPSDTG